MPEGIARPETFNNRHVKEVVLSSGQLLVVLSEVMTMHERHVFRETRIG